MTNREEDTVYERGLALRREVLGDQYVQNAMDDDWTFDSDFQDLIVSHVWGTIWARDNLSHRDRSFLNVAMIAALNRPNQLEAHLKGALNNGLTPSEIREIFIQVSAYCGMPTGIECFRIARKVFEELNIKA